MTQRKPKGLDFETWIDKQIRDAERDGLFDDLPGKGKPIPDLDQPRDELWWVREKLKREGIQYLPPGLQLRKDLQDLRDEVLTMRQEAKVREAVLAFNVRIRHVNSHNIDGPPSNLMPLDVEREVERWRSGRDRTREDAVDRDQNEPVSPPEPPTRRRWWSARRSPGRRRAMPS
jgi:hypothetical protein